MSHDIRVLLAGAGRAGLVHGRNLAQGIPGARLIAVADPSREARERAALELGCELIFDDPIEAVKDDRVDAVVIAAPTFTHADIAVAALDLGKHVLSEKPLAASLGEGRRIADAEAQSNGSFSMAFMRRFDRRFVRASERILAGDIGEPILVRSSGRGPGLPPEWAWDPDRSGGLIAEVNSHDLDTVRWLSDQEFSSAHALGRAAKRPDIKEKHSEFTDVVIVSFELSKGALAQVDGACPAGYGYDARVEVLGTEGTVLVGGPIADTAVVVRSDGVMADPVTSWRELFAAAYREEDAHFVSVAHGEAKPRTGADDGLRALEAVLTVRRSLTEGRPATVAEVTSE
jgi:predicted dehydrogenase